jgi:hypothetical protein
MVSPADRSGGAVLAASAGNAKRASGSFRRAAGAYIERMDKIGADDRAKDETMRAVGLFA